MALFGLSRKTAKRSKIDKHVYTIKWSKEDNEYIGLCKGFKSLSWLSSTQIGAFKGIKKLVSDYEKCRFFERDWD